jgi:hypothetical protein
MPGEMRRRSFLRLGLAGVGGTAVGVWSQLAYFSRPGENYWNRRQAKPQRRHFASTP